MSGGDVLNSDEVKEIADHYGKTSAQVIIRWHLQYNNIVIPKSVTPSRIEENFDVFDFALSDDDMKEMAELDRNQRKGPEPSELNVR